MSLRSSIKISSTFSSSWGSFWLSKMAVWIFSLLIVSSSSARFKGGARFQHDSYKIAGALLINIHSD